MKPEGEGVSALRVDFGSGYRVYFGQDGDQLVILLAGGTKRRQENDIQLASPGMVRIQRAQAKNKEGEGRCHLRGVSESRLWKNYATKTIVSAFLPRSHQRYVGRGSGFGKDGPARVRQWDSWLYESR